VIDAIRSETPEQRQKFIIDVFTSSFGDSMAADPDAWRGKFRKMAASPFAFYRGSAALYYADMARDGDAFAEGRAARVWIQGDLHAENFGSYMNGAGVLVFDVNDFDEAYVAPFTWDVRRLVASLALIGYQKAMSDDEIREMIAVLARSYAAQVARFASGESSRDFALTLDNTTGALQTLLQQARLDTRVAHLDRITTIDNYDRRFSHDKIQSPVDADTRAKVEAAFERYLETIPPAKRFGNVSYHIKDICATRGVGIGSAGLKLYSLLLEGPTQALENDIIISMKQAQTAAPSRVIGDAAIRGAFKHNGHRTVVSQRALQAYADPWLGHTELDGVGQLVAEYSPYTADLEWDNINRLDDILELLGYLGQAMAKIHCVSDDDSDQTIVPYSIDEAIHGALKGREDGFVAAMVAFGEQYGAVTRNDHRLFVDAFRNHLFPALEPAGGAEPRGSLLSRLFGGG